MSKHYAIKHLSVKIKKDKLKDFILAVGRHPEPTAMDDFKVLAEDEGFVYEVVDGDVIITDLERYYDLGTTEDKFWQNGMPHAEPGSIVDFFDDSDYGGRGWSITPERGKVTDEDAEREWNATHVELDKKQLEDFARFIWDNARNGGDFTPDSIKLALSLVHKKVPLTEEEYYAQKGQ